jgi:hypothetical protein
MANPANRRLGSPVSNRSRRCRLTSSRSRISRRSSSLASNPVSSSPTSSLASAPASSGQVRSCRIKGSAAALNAGHPHQAQQRVLVGVRRRPGDRRDRRADPGRPLAEGKPMMLDPSTFEYLKPTDEQLERMAHTREAFARLALQVELHVPDGIDRAHVMRLIRSAAMWAHVAITRHLDGSPRDLQPKAPP